VAPEDSTLEDFTLEDFTSEDLAPEGLDSGSSLEFPGPIVSLLLTDRDRSDFTQPDDRRVDSGILSANS
jgi:hypothetical protein